MYIVLIIRLRSLHICLSSLICLLMLWCFMFCYNFTFRCSTGPSFCWSDEWKMSICVQTLFWHCQIMVLSPLHSGHHIVLSTYRLLYSWHPCLFWCISIKWGRWVYKCSVPRVFIIYAQLWDGPMTQPSQRWQNEWKSAKYQKAKNSYGSKRLRVLSRIEDVSHFCIKIGGIWRQSDIIARQPMVGAIFFLHIMYN